MISSYTLTEARANLPLLLNKAVDGEEITITRHGRPAAVIVSHDRWMKTARYEVLEEARKLHRDLEERRSKPFPGWPQGLDYDAEGHIAELRENDDQWNEIERGDV